MAYGPMIQSGGGTVSGQVTTNIPGVNYYRNAVYKKGGWAYMCIDAYSSTPFQFAPSVNQYFQLPDGIRPDSKAFDANGYVAVNGSGDGSSSSSGSFSTARSVNYGQIGADGKIYQSYSSAYYWKRVQITGVFPCEE